MNPLLKKTIDDNATVIAAEQVTLAEDVIAEAGHSKPRFIKMLSYRMWIVAFRMAADTLEARLRHMEAEQGGKGERVQ